MKLSQLVTRDRVLPEADLDRLNLPADDSVRNVVRISNALSDEMAVMRRSLLPGLLRGENTRESRDHAKALLEQLGLGKRLDHLPTQLSGGEQQRVAIARALANQPTILLADEPTGNLDVRNSNLVFDLLTRLAKDNGQAVVLVTHNPEIAQRCDVTRPMRDGVFV